MKCNKMPSWLNVRPFQQTVRNIVPKKCRSNIECRSKEISFGHRIENKENKVDAERRHIFLTSYPSTGRLCAAPRFLSLDGMAVRCAGFLSVDGTAVRSAGVPIPRRDGCALTRCSTLQWDSGVLRRGPYYAAGWWCASPIFHFRNSGAHTLSRLH